MSDIAQNSLPSPEGPDEEGMFDAQLTLPLSATPWAAPVTEIVKRDGRREPFDKSKIAEAIQRATPPESALESDTADSIASAVAIYLAKRLDGRPATADQVSDAVERVLIQLTQPEVALAYARYRDRRARIRRLRKGDMQALLSELEEAQQERTAFLARDMALHVQTSQDRMVKWDRNRIVEALQLETGMDPALASIVAAEVERQIQAAGISVLTASLVRELVGAKLIEHGLTEENERRRRLGVPLYDASRIIRGLTEETLGATPGITDSVLAKAVKKEYALAEVFSAPVTQAHLHGEIHLDALEFVDRLAACEYAWDFHGDQGRYYRQMLEFISAGSSGLMLVAHVMRQYEFLQDFFSGSITCHAFNFLAAPFLQRADEGQMQAFARMFLLECSSHASMHARPPMEVSLHWTVPPALSGTSVATEAGSEISYKSLEPVARRLFWAVLEVCKSSDALGADYAAPVVEVVLEESMFQSLEGGACLLQAARAALERSNIRFVMSRTPLPNEASARSQTGAGHNVVWQRVALNLPRAAVVAEHEADFWRLTERLCQLAVTAHIEKRNFIEAMLDDRGATPLSALASKAPNSGSLDSVSGRFPVEVDGLFECAEIMLGSGQASFTDRVAFMEKTLERIASTVAELAGAEGMACSVSANSNPKISARFASVDAGLYPRLVDTILKPGRATSDLSYTCGIALPQEHALSPFDRARIEGTLHRHLSERLFTRIPAPLKRASENTLVDLLKKVLHQTECSGLILKMGGTEER